MQSTGQAINQVEKIFDLLHSKENDDNLSSEILLKMLDFVRGTVNDLDKSLSTQAHPVNSASDETESATSETWAPLDDTQHKIEHFREEITYFDSLQKRIEEREKMERERSLQNPSTPSQEQKPSSNTTPHSRSRVRQLAKRKTPNKPQTTELSREPLSFQSAFSPHTLVSQSVYVPKHTAYSDFPAVDPLSINHTSHKIRNRDDPLNPVYPAEPATTYPPAHLPPPEPPQPEPVFHPIEPSAPPAEESETLVVEPSAPTAEEEASHEISEAKKDAVFPYKQPTIVDVPHKTITMDAPPVQPTRIVLPSAPTEEEEKQADEDLHQPREDAESIEEGRHAQEHRKRGLSRASSSFPLTRPEEENERRLALDDVVKYAEQRWDEREGSAKSAVQQLTQMELLQNDREEQMHKIDEDLTEQYEKDLRAMKDPFDRALREQDEREAELDLLAEEGHDMKQTYQEQIQETVDLIRHEKEELLKAMAEWREEKEKERGMIDESGRNEIRRLSEAVDALREELGSLQYQIQILKEEKAKLQETHPKAATQPQQQPLSPRWETTIGKTRQSHQILSTPFSRQSDRGPTATPNSTSSFLGTDADTRKDQMRPTFISPRKPEKPQRCISPDRSGGPARTLQERSRSNEIRRISRRDDRH